MFFSATRAEWGGTVANAGEQPYHGEGWGSGGAVLMWDRPTLHQQAARPPPPPPRYRRADRKQVALPVPPSPG